LLTAKEQPVTTRTDLAGKIEDMERKYDVQFRVVFDAIRELMRQPEPGKKKIGFMRE
jgi:hypothetical protein